MTSKSIPCQPIVAYDSGKKILVHLYENTNLDPSTFKSEVALYLPRKESFSNHVAVVHKLKDEQIGFRGE